MKKCMSVSEARRQFSRLIARVSQGEGAVTITQHGKEQVTVMSTAEYETLVQKAHAFERSQDEGEPFTVRGSLELDGTPEELEEALHQVRDAWGKSTRQSAADLTREMARS